MYYERSESAFMTCPQLSITRTLRRIYNVAIYSITPYTLLNTGNLGFLSSLLTLTFQRKKKTASAICQLLSFFSLPGMPVWRKRPHGMVTWDAQKATWSCQSVNWSCLQSRNCFNLSQSIFNQPPPMSDKILINIVHLYTKYSFDIVLLSL